MYWKQADLCLPPGAARRLVVKVERHLKAINHHPVRSKAKRLPRTSPTKTGRRPSNTPELDYRPRTHAPARVTARWLRRSLACVAARSRRRSLASSFAASQFARVAVCLRRSWLASRWLASPLAGVAVRSRCSLASSFACVAGRSPFARLRRSRSLASPVARHSPARVAVCSRGCLLALPFTCAAVRLRCRTHRARTAHARTRRRRHRQRGAAAAAASAASLCLSAQETPGRLLRSLRVCTPRFCTEVVKLVYPHMLLAFCTPAFWFCQVWCCSAHMLGVVRPKNLKPAALRRPTPPPF